jgi:hypothetical protein
MKRIANSCNGAAFKFQICLASLYAAVGGGWHTGEPLVDAATRQQMEQLTNWGDLLCTVPSQCVWGFLSPLPSMPA